MVMENSHRRVVIFQFEEIFEEAIFKSAMIFNHSLVALKKKHHKSCNASTISRQ